MDVVASKMSGPVLCDNDHKHDTNHELVPEATPSYLIRRYLFPTKVMAGAWRKLEVTLRKSKDPSTPIWVRDDAVDLRVGVIPEMTEVPSQMVQTRAFRENVHSLKLGVKRGADVWEEVRLETLPAWLGALQNLRSLSLEGMDDFPELEHAEKALGNVERLWLAGTAHTTTLPSWVGRLPNLKQLRVHRFWKLKELPGWMASLTGLQILDFSGWQDLEELPEWIGSLVGLQTLDLTGCQNLKALSKGIGSLTGLQTLNLSGCESLKKLPEKMESLKGLRELDLSGCESLTELPKWLGSLTGLQTFNLSFCKGLTELPGEMGSLTGLHTLDLSSCKGMKELPVFLGSLTGLHSLILSGWEGLEKLPECVALLTELQTLDLSECRGLKKLPEKMKSLTSLQALDLTRCGGLDKLPGWIGSLTGLRTLGCNRLRDQTKTSFTGGSAKSGAVTLPSAPHSSAALAESTATLKSEGYELLEPLDKGAQGTVWRAKNGEGKQFAIKIFLRDSKRVKEEVLNLQALHKPIVQQNVVEFVEFVEPSAVVMELIDGQNLKARLEARRAGKADKRLPPKETEWVMQGLLRGLSVLHEKKIIHRDIKPANIMLRGNGDGCNRVVIVDLGTSKKLLSKEAGFEGTLEYASFEQINGDESEFEMDVWAAGVVYFEMLEGKRPFAGRDAVLKNNIRTAQMPRLEAWVGDAVGDFLSVALAKEAKKRFPDGTHMLAVFEQVCKNPSATPESFSVPSDGAWAKLLRTDPEKALETRADFDKRPLLEDGKGGGPKTRGIAVFSAKGVSKIQVHQEAQQIVRTFDFPYSPVDVQVHPHPDADDFRETSSSFEQKKVAVVHISGHTNVNGEVPVLEGL
ncbi:hypothetical protein T484DRAFT_1852918 [Baffinella frigidus]|nr:hypothetical protein T484DRAFT_1852918 [Cryptophyta sp. CCMP2293]